MSRAEDYLRAHPFTGTAIAFGVGIALQAAGKLASAQVGRAADTDTLAEDDEPAPKAEPPARLPPPDKSARRTHDTGAADMKFTAAYPDGASVLFAFTFKKHPLDAPESDWPLDTMGFTLDRPNGKHLAFRFDRKSRPIPPEDPDQPAGLGRGTMEFVSSRPDRGDFRFTWNRTPPGETPPEGKQTDWPSDPERSRQ